MLSTKKLNQPCKKKYTIEKPRQNLNVTIYVIFKL